MPESKTMRGFRRVRRMARINGEVAVYGLVNV